MVSFGTIDFNQLKGHNPVMASGPMHGNRVDTNLYGQMVNNLIDMPITR